MSPLVIIGIIGIIVIIVLAVITFIIIGTFFRYVETFIELYYRPIVSFCLDIVDNKPVLIVENTGNSMARNINFCQAPSGSKIENFAFYKHGLCYLAPGQSIVFYYPIDNNIPLVDNWKKIIESEYYYFRVNYKNNQEKLYTDTFQLNAHLYKDMCEKI